MQRFFLVLLALAGLQAGSLHAQRAAGAAFPTIDRSLPSDPSSRSPVDPTNAFPRHEVHPALLAAGGVVGGAVGVFGGAFAGAYLTRGSCEDCAIVGAAYGAVIGGSALLPLGVHLANGRRGQLRGDVAGLTRHRLGGPRPCRSHQFGGSGNGGAGSADRQRGRDRAGHRPEALDRAAPAGSIQLPLFVVTGTDDTAASFHPFVPFRSTAR